MPISHSRFERFRSLISMTAVLAVTAALALPASAAVSKSQVKAWRAAMRKALFIPDPLPQLDAKVIGSFSPTPGVTVDRVTYNTQYGLRIPALVYRPTHVSGKIPGLVVVNGHGADKTSWYSYYTGILYAKAGVAVVTYDPIGEGERNDDHKDATGEHDRLINITGVPPRMGGLMVTDVMQGVSYLRSMPQVDPHRIGVLGFSMGSFIASLTGAVDPRFHALFLTGGGDLDGPGGYWDSSHAVMCQSGPYHALNVLGPDRPAVIFTLNARRGPTFMYNGSADHVVAITTHGPDFFSDLRNRVIALNGSSKNVFTYAFDQGAGHRPAWVLKIPAVWLDQNLHFANWTPAQIQALPTVKIRDWAQKNDVPMKPSALRESVDGGLDAIDAGVPHLTPEDLNVLPVDEWQQRKADFVYSTWAKDAIAAAEADNNSAATPSPGKGL